MAVAELSRMLFAVNTIMEKASSVVGLSKRAASALAILYLEDGAELTNAGLQKRFIEFKVSTDQSAQKDASSAKSVLLRAKHIEIRGKVSVFGLTEQGRDTVLKIYHAMNKALEDLGLSDEERSVLRKLVDLPEPRPPAKPNASVPSSKPVRQKSS